MHAYGRVVAILLACVVGSGVSNPTTRVSSSANVILQGQAIGRLAKVHDVLYLQGSEPQHSVISRAERSEDDASGDIAQEEGGDNSTIITANTTTLALPATTVPTTMIKPTAIQTLAAESNDDVVFPWYGLVAVGVFVVLIGIVLWRSCRKRDDHNHEDDAYGEPNKSALPYMPADFLPVKTKSVVCVDCLTVESNPFPCENGAFGVIPNGSRDGHKIYGWYCAECWAVTTGPNWRNLASTVAQELAKKELQIDVCRECQEEVQPMVTSDVDVVNYNDSAAIYCDVCWDREFGYECWPTVGEYRRPRVVNVREETTELNSIIIVPDAFSVEPVFKSPTLVARADADLDRQIEHMVNTHNQTLERETLLFPTHIPPEVLKADADLDKEIESMIRSQEQQVAFVKHVCRACQRTFNSDQGIEESPDDDDDAEWSEWLCFPCHQKKIDRTTSNPARSQADDALDLQIETMVLSTQSHHHHQQQQQQHHHHHHHQHHEDHPHDTSYQATNSTDNGNETDDDHQHNSNNDTTYNNEDDDDNDYDDNNRSYHDGDEVEEQEHEEERYDEEREGQEQADTSADYHITYTTNNANHTTNNDHSNSKIAYADEDLFAQIEDMVEEHEADLKEEDECDDQIAGLLDVTIDSVDLADADAGDDDDADVDVDADVDDDVGVDVDVGTHVHVKENDDDGDDDTNHRSNTLNSVTDDNEDNVNTSKDNHNNNNHNHNHNHNDGDEDKDDEEEAEEEDAVVTLRPKKREEEEGHDDRVVSYLRTTTQDDTDETFEDQEMARMAAEWIMAQKSGDEGLVKRLSTRVDADLDHTIESMVEKHEGELSRNGSLSQMQSYDATTY